jgi:hypothetical protein
MHSPELKKFSISLTNSKLEYLKNEQTANFAQVSLKPNYGYE